MTEFEDIHLMGVKEVIETGPNQCKIVLSLSGIPPVDWSDILRDLWKKLRSYVSISYFICDNITMECQIDFSESYINDLVVCINKANIKYRKMLPKIRKKALKNKEIINKLRHTKF